MKNKSFAVIGLGQFGMTLAVTLAESDCDVLAIDDKEENIEECCERKGARRLFEENRCESTDCIWYAPGSHQDGTVGACVGKRSFF